MHEARQLEGRQRIIANDRHGILATRNRRLEDITTREDQRLVPAGRACGVAEDDPLPGCLGGRDRVPASDGLAAERSPATL
jgi:hypothetical protein